MSRTGGRVRSTVPESWAYTGLPERKASTFSSVDVAAGVPGPGISQKPSLSGSSPIERSRAVAIGRRGAGATDDNARSAIPRLNAREIVPLVCREIRMGPSTFSEDGRILEAACADRSEACLSCARPADTHYTDGRRACSAFVAE